MSISDPLIIYLAIGSPFGVYHFLRSRRTHGFREFLEVISIWLFWPAYAVWLFKRSKTSGPSRISYSPDYDSLDAATAKRVDELRFEMEKAICSDKPGRSILEFREVFERYVGLTGEMRAAGGGTTSPFSEIIPNAGENANLNGICLNRRNRRQLEFHQIRARNDFLSLAAEMSGDFEHLAFELSEVLLDGEGLEVTSVDQVPVPQSKAEPSVTDLESEVWPSKAHRQSATGRI